MAQELRVSRVAHQVRAALESMARERRPFGYAPYPMGWCGLASAVLAAALNRYSGGAVRAEYISGERAVPFHSHAWVEVDGTIIDITADQFHDVADAVWITRDRSWHQQFGEVVRCAGWKLEGAEVDAFRYVIEFCGFDVESRRGDTE